MRYLDALMFTLAFLIGGWAGCMAHTDSFTLRPRVETHQVYWDFQDSGALEQAMAEWNVVVGRVVFSPLRGERPILVHMVQDGYLEGNRIGQATVATDGCVILIEASYWHNTDIFTHELGHCMGFDHTKNDKNSIMYPDYTPGQTINDNLKTVLKKHL